VSPLLQVGTAENFWPVRFCPNMLPCEMPHGPYRAVFVCDLAMPPSAGSLLLSHITISYSEQEQTVTWCKFCLIINTICSSCLSNVCILDMPQECSVCQGVHVAVIMNCELLLRFALPIHEQGWVHQKARFRRKDEPLTTSI